MVRTIIILVALPAMMAAQALVQYSVAAAVGAAAGATMGKQLSNTLDKVMASAAEAADPKGYTKQPDGPYQKNAKRASASQAATASAAKPGATVAAVRVPSPSARGTLFRVPVPDYPGLELNLPPPAEEDVQAEPPPPPPQPSADLMRELEQGAVRNQVVARLGSPMARVTMPGDGGGLVEIYYYQSKGETLGSVRFNDGALSSVIVNQ